MRASPRDLRRDGELAVSERAAPMYCPYCGEEDIRPWGDDPDQGHADWRCESCLRAFTVRYKGLTGKQ